MAKIASLWLLSFFPPKTPTGVKNVATEAFCWKKVHQNHAACMDALIPTIF